jgi:hypothetical protein
MASSPDPPIRYLKLNPYKVVIANRIDVLPGQKIRFDNTTFFWVRIFSDLPFAIRDGKCQADSTTDITCDIMPNVLVRLRDVRIGIPVDSAPANRVHFTFMRDAP